MTTNPHRPPRQGQRRPRRFRPAVALGVAALALLACTELLTESYQYGSVEVRAKRRSGEPVPGVLLTLYDPGKHMAYGKTDSSGVHVFEFVPANAYGVQAIVPEGYATLQLREDTYRDGLALGDGERTEVQFTFLKKGPGAVRVRVVGKDGEAVSGARLVLYQWTGPIAEGTTDRQGQHLFERVPFGDYGVWLTPPHGYVLPQGGKPYVDRILVEEGRAEDVSFATIRCEGRLRVEIRDDAGGPVRGVGLMLYTFRGVQAEGRTDDAGVHEFRDLVCGDYGVILRPVLGYRFAPGPMGTFRDGLVVGLGETRTAAFVLQRCEGELTVRVEDERGAPVSGAELQLYALHADLSSGRTDASGTHVFRSVPCTSVGVRLTPPAGYSAASGRGGSYVDDIGIERGTRATARFVVRRN